MPNRISTDICAIKLFQLEKSEPKKSKKKQVYVPVYLDLPEVHTTDYATICCTILFALQFPLTSISLCVFLFMFRSHTHQMSLVQPSGDMSVKIREELREPDADTITKDVAAIREWLEKQPHLPKDMG